LLRPYCWLNDVRNRDTRLGMSSLRSRRGGIRTSTTFQAIVEVFPELTPRNRLLEITIRRRDDTRVDVDHAVTADARETEILQDVQELRLERQR